MKQKLKDRGIQSKKDAYKIFNGFLKYSRSYNEVKLLYDDIYEDYFIVIPTVYRSRKVIKNYIKEKREKYNMEDIAIFFRGDMGSIKKLRVLESEFGKEV